jgi:hypothetical protein
MRIASKIVIVATLCFLYTKATTDIIGNLAFYGRGQRHLPNYWNDIKDIKGSNHAKVFFPFNDSDDNSTEGAKREEAASSNDIVDVARNYPLVLYIPGRPKNGNYSSIVFSVIGNDKEEPIELTSFHKIKSEMKIVPPRVTDLVDDGIVELNEDGSFKNLGINPEDLNHENIDLQSIDINNLDLSKNIDLWEQNVDIRLFFESEEINNDPEYTKEEILLYHFEIDNFEQPTTRWKECKGDINKSKIISSNILYSDFVIRNYGVLPVYLYIGNTIFLKKEPTVMVKEGKNQNEFQNWSWHKSQNSANKTATYYEGEQYKYPGDDKGCVKFVSKEDGDAAYYVHIDGGISAPPEGVSFRVRPMNDSTFKFKIDNKKEFNLTGEYLVHRNCKIPIEEETEVLVDVRSLVYSDPKFMLMNDINGFWVQQISEIKAKKNITEKLHGKEAAEAYEEVFYFYDFILHNTYPEDPENEMDPYDPTKKRYVKQKLFEDGDECRLTLETHEDWEDKSKTNEADPVIAWPDDIDFDTVFKSKHSIIITVDDLDDENKNNENKNNENKNNENKNNENDNTNNNSTSKPGGDKNKTEDSGVITLNSINTLITATLMTLLLVVLFY